MLKYLLTILKYACPALIAVLLCLIVVGLLKPWPVAEAAIGPGSAKGALLIGWSYDYQVSGASSHERREQTYALLPTLKTITVIQENGAVRTEEEPNGLISSIASYALVFFGAWWFWIRPKKVGAPR